VTRRIWKSAVCALVAMIALAGARTAYGEHIDPDQSAKVSADVNLSLLTVKTGVYQLIVQNQSGLGSINSFAWVPGPGWSVTTVLGASRGTCTVVDAALLCTAKISPPKLCTCQPGGRLTITFRMTGPRAPAPSAKTGKVSYGTAGGYVVVKTMTMVRRHIPTTLPND
jgi:hypothetical protein